MEISTIQRLVEWVAILLSWVSLPLLGVAAVVHLQRPKEDLPHHLAWPARIGQAVVAVLVGVGVTAAVLKDVPLAFGWAAVAAIAVMAFILRRDERFWVTLAVLLVVFTAIGAVILVALSHNYRSPDGLGLWYGGRQLVAWGGINANPTQPGWGWTVVALAVTRYGLPLALVLTTSWLVSVRGAMTRIERLGLVAASESLFVTVLIGASFSIVVLGAGVLQGLPVALVVAGVLGSVFTLLTVGPGAVNGLLVGGRTLASRVPTAATGAFTLVSSLDDAREAEVLGAEDQDEPEPDSTWRSFLGFVSGDVGVIKRWNLRLLGVFGAFVVVGMFGGGCTQRIDDSESIRFEPIAAEVGAGFEVAEAIRDGEDAVWLLGDEGELALFRPSERSVARSDLGAFSLAEAGGEVLALTREAPSRVLALDPEAPHDPDVVVTLSRRAAGRLAADARDVYVAGAGGRLTRFDPATGEAQAQVDDTPAVLVVAQEDALWTVHAGPGSPTRPYRVVRRDRATLEPRGGPDGVDPLDIASGRTAADQSIVRLVAAAFVDLAGDGEVRLFAGEDGARWVATGIGELRHDDGDGGTRTVHVHYDSVHGVFETADGTWLLVDDDQGTIVDRTEAAESRLALWEGP